MHAHTIELDGRKLKAKAEKSHELQTLLYHGAHRERNREVTDIEQMRKAIEKEHGETLDPVKWAEAFQELEEMDLGALILGRRGKPNRFKWNYSLKAIGNAAMNGITVTAHRIATKTVAGKQVNDYNRSRRNLEDIPPPRRPLERPALKMVPEVRDPEQSVGASGASHHVYLMLRPDFTFEANLPSLTEREADVLCAAIKRCVKK